MLNDEEADFTEKGNVLCSPGKGHITLRKICIIIQRNFPKITHCCSALNKNSLRYKLLGSQTLWG